MKSDFSTWKLVFWHTSFLQSCMKILFVFQNRCRFFSKYLLEKQTNTLTLVAKLNMHTTYTAPWLYQTIGARFWAKIRCAICRKVIGGLSKSPTVFSTEKWLYTESTNCVVLAHCSASTWSSSTPEEIWMPPRCWLLQGEPCSYSEQEFSFKQLILQTL